MPTIEPHADSAMTPNRVTRAIFDPDDQVMTNEFWGGQRLFQAVSAIASQEKGGDSALCSNVFPWSSGAWTLRPKQWDLGTFAESASGAILMPSSGLTAVDNWEYKTNAAGDFDPFLRKKGQGSGYAALSPTAKVSSLSAALSSTANLLPIAKSTSLLPINQGLCLRFGVNGVISSASGWIGAVIFGQYAIGLRGNGMAEIWEYGTPSGGSPVWRHHNSFRYSKPNQINTSAHHMMIFPHVGPTGEKYISFASLSLDSPEQASAGLGSTPGGGGATSTTDKLFTWEETRTDLPDQSGGSGNVTISERLWILERPTVRSVWQPSKLVFEASGNLTSEFWASPPGDTRAVSIQFIRTIPSGCSVSYAYYGPTGTVTTTPAAAFFIKWAFSGPGSTTPLLWGYKVSRSPTFDSSTPSSFSPGSTSFRIQSGVSDPRSEIASLRCEDKFDAYPRLRTRAELPLKIVVTDSSSGSPVDVTLFRGVAISPLRTKLGKAGKRAGLGGWGSALTHPSAQWSQYQITAAGMWYRLQEKTLRGTLSYENFAYDATSTTLQPWKVTDAIKHLLTVGGFPSTMQNIPDLGIRLWPGIGTQDSDRILEPSTSIAEMIVRLCRNYLGRFLVFDANQGTYGKWTLVGAPTSTTALAAFVGGPTWSAGDAILPGACLASYPAGTAPTFGRRESYYIAPENNHLWAFTLVDSYNTGGFRVDNHLYNYKSYKVPGATVAPDPDSPHYLGRERIVILADPALWAGAAIGGWAETQKAVDFILFRLFAFTCMARERMRFQAPLLFITDPSTSRKRPLQFYDVVTLDGAAGWYVRSCTPRFDHDRQMTADYELERLVAYQP